MSRVVAALAFVLGARTALGDDALTVRVEVDAADVDFGKAFPLRVVRSWPAAQEVAPFDDAALAPLKLRELSESRSDSEGRIEETRTYRAYAFETGEVEVVPAISVRGAPQRTRRGEKLILRVRPALDPASPGPVELPPDPLPERHRTWPWIVGAAAVFCGLVWLAMRRARRTLVPSAAPAPAPSIDPRRRALAGLDALGSRPMRTASESLAFHVELERVLREFVAERLGLDVRSRTSEEIEILVPDGPRSNLRNAFDVGDRVKFAGHESSEGERRTALVAARQFVEMIP